MHLVVNDHTIDQEKNSFKKNQEKRYRPRKKASFKKKIEKNDIDQEKTSFKKY